MAAKTKVPQIALIGERGRMGQMLHSRLTGAAFPVLGADIPLTDSVLAAACGPADVVLLCVPAAHLRATCRLLRPHMRPQTILADITSVKMQPLEDMRKEWPGPVVGTHPLFGPQPSPDSDLPVVLTPGSQAGPEHCALVEQIFRALGCRVFQSTAALHDEAMAAIQGLNFISSVAYFATLAHKDEYLPFLTPSFRRRQEAARKLLTEDAALFEGLFEANPYSQETVRRFRTFLNVAAGGDISLLSAWATWWWKEPPAPESPAGADARPAPAPLPIADRQS